jgi:hypothetical protein
VSARLTADPLPVLVEGGARPERGERKSASGDLAISQLRRLTRVDARGILEYGAEIARAIVRFDGPTCSPC